MFENTKIRFKRDVVSRTVHGEEVILDPIKGHYFGLNAFGTQIWNWLKSGKSLVEVSEQALEEYDVEPDRLEKDIEGWIESLESKGLIESER